MLNIFDIFQLSKICVGKAGQHIYVITTTTNLNQSLSCTNYWSHTGICWSFSQEWPSPLADFFWFSQHSIKSWGGKSNSKGIKCDEWSSFSVGLLATQTNHHKRLPHICWHQEIITTSIWWGMKGRKWWHKSLPSLTEKYIYIYIFVITQ